MRTLDIRGVARRRWLVLVSGLVATALLATAAFLAIGPTQEIKASGVLLPPATSVVNYPDREAPGNPFLRLDGMNPVLAVLTTAMASEEMSDRMLADAPQTTYTVEPDPVSQAPVVVVTVSGSDAAEASRVLDRVTQQIPRTLEQLQDDAGVREAQRITLMPLVRDEEVTVVWRGLLRIEILIIGLGLVATSLLAALWDAVALSRSVRRISRSEEQVSPARDDEVTAAGGAGRGRSRWTRETG